MGRGEAKPMMADCEIEIMASLFEAQRPKSVLEFGAGHSTRVWPDQMKGLLQWVAIEHSVRWFNELQGKVDERVDLRLRKRRDYYAPLLLEGGWFDFILVDGLYRCACMLVASLLLAPGGIVVLHDAGRPEYLASWDVFPYHELLYPGELPLPGGHGFRHRGVAVLWGDEDVETKDWCRDHKAVRKG